MPQLPNQLVSAHAPIYSTLNTCHKEQTPNPVPIPQVVTSTSLNACQTQQVQNTLLASPTDKYHKGNTWQVTKTPNSVQTQLHTVPKSASAVGTPLNIPAYVQMDSGNPSPKQTIPNKKEIHPDIFDGSGKTEWSDYVVHFEQCANWNQWSDSQKAQMLSIHLRGEAQRLLSGLTVGQLSNYYALRQIVSDRYEPKEKDVAYRCQFRICKREKGESASDYGYRLTRLSQKAYPNLTLNQLEIHVLDQFITGLGNYELQKHVQFGHPKTLHEAIGLATEFEALEGSVDRVKKPSIGTENIAPIITQNTHTPQIGSITLEQIDKLLDKKLNTLSVNTRSRSTSPAPSRFQRSPKPRTENKEPPSTTQSTGTRMDNPRADKFCTYCKRYRHNIDECRQRKFHERKQQEKQGDPET
ncbi:MAG: hypothetical protein N0E48_19110, partial [Candidatus Thiodiazotropha endolucinida]|nr:hypothetical protein [Candidatus Thiodiazotropha taylori]MCW4345447.1 hypothetical protein [Candidatus Thiodiazotropha endolucinida]